MKRMRLFLVFALLLGYASTCLYILDMTDLGVRTTLGNPDKVVTESGLHLKWPYPFGGVIRYDKRLQVYDIETTEYLTEDKKNITVSSYVAWKIADPLRFLRAVSNRAAAEARLSLVVTSELGTALGKHPFSALVSQDPEDIAYPEILNVMLERCRASAAKDYGIDIVDVRIKRLNFPDQNKASVFERMRTERERIARKFRSEGEEEAAKIRATADKEKSNILSEARSKAAILKGEGEAEAARIYNGAVAKDPAFYEFLRTLETYKKILNERTTLVIPGDAPLMKVLLEGKVKSQE